MAQAGEIKMTLGLDTREFDRQIARVQRKVWFTRAVARVWLWTYAAAMTGAAAAFAVVAFSR